jgi:hypothetical protein
MVYLASGALLLRHVTIGSIEDGKFKIPKDTGWIGGSHPHSAIRNLEY